MLVLSHSSIATPCREWTGGLGRSPGARPLGQSKKNAHQEHILDSSSLDATAHLWSPEHARLASRLRAMQLAAALQSDVLLDGCEAVAVALGSRRAGGCLLSRRPVLVRP